MTEPRERPWAAIGVGIMLALMGALLLILQASRPARGQEHHSAHHATYQNWINGASRGCCNNNDCGELPDKDERTEGGQLQVRVEGEWCPVLAHHYLTRGNAPDHSTAHVCVLRKYGDADKRSVCERFVCYQPKPLS